MLGGCRDNCKLKRVKREAPSCSETPTWCRLTESQGFKAAQHQRDERHLSNGQHVSGSGRACGQPGIQNQCEESVTRTGSYLHQPQMFCLVQVLVNHKNDLNDPGLGCLTPEFWNSLVLFILNLVTLKSPKSSVRHAARSRHIFQKLSSHLTRFTSREDLCGLKKAHNSECTSVQSARTTETG